MVKVRTAAATRRKAAGTDRPGIKERPGRQSALPLAPGAEALVLSGSDAIPVEVQQPGGEVVEPGRALVLADFASPSLGASQRLIRLAYRMGVPSSLLTKPVGKAERTRILATVANPLPGNRAAGTALRAGHFLVHGAKLPVAQVDFGGAARMAPPFEKVIHGFSWLGDLEAAAPREQVTAVAERVLAAWLKANRSLPKRPGSKPAWTIANTGARLLNWIVHAPLILSGEKALRNQALQTIADTARWLDRNVHKADDLLGETAGWCAIVAAGLLLPEGKPRRLFGEAGLVQVLGEVVGDDGGLMSRSPLAQMEAIALLIQLRACYEAIGETPLPIIDGVLRMMVPPLLALTHGDGSLSSWQGAWAVSAAEIAALVAASRIRTRPLRDVRQWGYQRVQAQKSLLLFDAAPPPLPRHARHGSASTLAFELSHEGHRLVVNCGGSACAGGLIPVRLEQSLRATAAHSTLTLDDTNSTAVLMNGKIGGGVSAVEIDRRTIEGDRAAGGEWGAVRLDASHDGYAARYGLNHRRILIFRDDGTELRGEDLLVPSDRKGRRGKVAFAIRFHLGPGVEARVSEDGRGAGLAMPDGSYWQFRSGAGDVIIEESLWADGQARPVPVLQIVIQGLVARSGGNFAWLLKKMG